MRSIGNRERIIRTVTMQEVDRLPLAFYFGLWGETYTRWKNEGCPAESPADWAHGLDMDPGFVPVDVNLGYFPSFERIVLEENADTRLVRNEFGITEIEAKNRSAIPKHVSNPVTCLADWQRLKAERLNPDSPERFPRNWPDLVKEYNEGDRVVQLGSFPYGLFGTLRDMIGEEEVLYMFYDDPGLIHTMMDDLTDFWLAIYKKVCRDVRVDAIHIWEDMSGKNGPLISPNMIREFMQPNYKRIRKFADENNIKIYALDTDGDVDSVIPVLLESGFNMLMPFEVIEGKKTIVEYQREYPDLCLMGGINKMEIVKGKAAIDRELSRIASVFKRGTGYMAAPDHLVPPEVSYDDFVYFVNQLRKYL